MSNLFDTIVIGAGQAGLASAYHLQRARSHRQLASHDADAGRAPAAHHNVKDL